MFHKIISERVTALLLLSKCKERKKRGHCLLLCEGQVIPWSEISSEKIGRWHIICGIFGSVSPGKLVYCLPFTITIKSDPTITTENGVT